MSASPQASLDRFTNIPNHLVLTANLGEGEVWHATNFQSILNTALQIGIHTLTIAVVLPQHQANAIVSNQEHFNELCNYVQTHQTQLSASGISVYIAHRTNPYHGTDLWAAHPLNLQLNLIYDHNGRKQIIDVLHQIQDPLSATSDLASQIEIHLAAPPLANPDLIIFTGGERCLMNLLTWQASYSEYLFLQTSWEAFNGNFLVEALEEYQTHQRRFGKG